MANINDNGLPQMKRILGDTGSSNDSTYLLYLQQAVYDADARIQGDMSVSVSGSDYTLSPDPGDTSTLWNVLALRAVYLYHKKLYQDFLDEMEGLDTVRDDVTAFGRGRTMDQKRLSLERELAEYKQALRAYRSTATGSTVSIEEIGWREDTDDS